MKSVIIIDDDEDIVQVFSYLLEQKHIKVVGKGYSGKDAVELYEKENPDIVFLDVMMPDGNGIYAIKKIKEINPNAEELEDFFKLNNVEPFILKTARETFTPAKMATINVKLKDATRYVGPIISTASEI